MALSWTLDKIGPMARSAADCALVLEAISGPDPKDVTTASKRFRRLSPEAAAEATGEVRIGYSGEEILDAASPEARDALLRGVDEMRRLFPRFVEGRLPEDVPYGPMVATVYAAEGATIFAELMEQEPARFDLMPDEKQKAGLRAALEIKARDYLQAMRLRSVLAERMREVFKSCDLILSAGRNVTATPIEQALDPPAPSATPAAPDASAPKKRPGNIGLIPAGNLAGLPAIFFPCGLGTDGLPVGLQLVGPAFSEPLLLAVAEAYQRETGHHLERPPLGS
jgi:aspartyl-tRNA(Asn)/glutamyl-tRNA(Gln) amidotransferase subunit A